MPIVPVMSFAGHNEPIVEILNLVDRALAGDCFAAFAEERANVGASFRTAFSNPISVSGLFSLLMMTADF